MTVRSVFFSLPISGEDPNDVITDGTPDGIMRTLRPLGVSLDEAHWFKGSRNTFNLDTWPNIYHGLVTEEVIENSVSEIARHVGKNDLSLIYFFGHGAAFPTWPEENHSELFLTENTLLSPAKLESMLAPLNGSDQLLIVSGCHTGDFGYLKTEDRVVFTQTSSNIAYMIGAEERSEYFVRASTAGRNVQESCDSANFDRPVIEVDRVRRYGEELGKLLNDGAQSAVHYAPNKAKWSIRKHAPWAKRIVDRYERIAARCKTSISVLSPKTLFGV